MACPPCRIYNPFPLCIPNNNSHCRTRLLHHTYMYQFSSLMTFNPNPCVSVLHLKKSHGEVLPLVGKATFHSLTYASLSISICNFTILDQLLRTYICFREAWFRNHACQC